MRSCPSTGAGTTPRERVRGEQDEEQEGRPRPALHGERRWRAAAPAASAATARPARRTARGSAPRAASSPRGSPRRRRSCRSAACAECEFSTTFTTEKSERDIGATSAPRRTSATSAKLPMAAAGADRTSAPRRRRAPPQSGTTRLDERQTPARARARNGRSRRSWRASSAWPGDAGAAGRSPCRPANGPASSARRRPRAACRSRRAWRARVSAGSCPAASKHAFGDDALPFAEQVGQQAAIARP